MLSRSHRVKKDARRGADLVHCWPLMRFLSSASLRKRHAKIVYVHVPKTGGTSMWAALTRAFPSHVFYPSLRAYLSNPPAPGDYDLVGLHFSPSVLLPSLGEDDWVIGMVRDPTQRLVSAVMHSRRKTEDPETFTASAKAMREMELIRYLETQLGRLEARLQLTTFGSDHRQPGDTLCDQKMLCSACALARRDNVILAPSEHSPAFLDLVAKRLAFRPGVLQRLNANEPAMLAAYLPELNDALGLLNSINAHEREFYDFVCRSFDQLRTTGRRRLGRRNGFFPVLSATLPSPVEVRTAVGQT